MVNITIDGVEYDSENLSEEAKAQLTSIKFIDSELLRMSMREAALKTARNAYGQRLAEILGADSSGGATEIEMPDSVSFD